MSRRMFGSLRVLPSGRVQARYLGPDGLRRTAPMTFDSKGAANRWLSLTEADIVRGTWIDPWLRGELLGPYAERWIRERPNLSERTIAFYEGLLRLHIAPVLGGVDVRKLSPGRVRTWRQGLIDAQVGESTVAKSYRLLRAVLNTAVEDEMINRNPCRIKGAGVDHTPERPVLTLAEVLVLANAIEPRYRAFVLLAVFGSLRWGELMGLRVSDFDVESGTVRIVRAVSEVGARQVIKAPKTVAGLRTVALPMWLVAELDTHFLKFSEPGPEGRVFVGAKGATPRRPNFARVWTAALKAAGLTGIHVHDLRHTGNHLAAISGASTRELMGRMGHASMRAALIYQHRTADRDRMIADSMDALLTQFQEQPGSGTVKKLGHATGTKTESNGSAGSRI